MKNAADYSGIVRAVRNTLHLKLKIRVGLVNSGGDEGVPAWVSMPKHMPPFGTTQFNQTTATLYLRKSFLEDNSAEAISFAIAHELSHVVLNGIGHTLRHEEEAVDLAAMIFGFSAAYSLVHKSKTGKSLGYLSAEEVRFAHNILQHGDSWTSIFGFRLRALLDFQRGERRAIIPISAAIILIIIALSTYNNGSR